MTCAALRSTTSSHVASRRPLPRAGFASTSLASALKAVYRHHPFSTDLPWIDIDIRLERRLEIRSRVRRTVHLVTDARHPFEPFPETSALPLMEWGLNWVLGQRMNHLLLFHAGAVEKAGYALVLPALPGSGKSTLTAALSLRGWRLLSDEFGAYDPEAGEFRAVLKPVALKNASIDVIRRFSPGAAVGPEFSKTSKGTVAHLAASPDAVARRHDTAKPGAFLLPRWQAGSALRLEPVPAQSLFASLSFNSFNYRVLGAVGFDAALELARGCNAWQLVYSDLDEATAAIDALWADITEDKRSQRCGTLGTEAASA